MDALAPEAPPQNQLEERLAAAADAHDDAAAGQEFVAALMDAQLGMPGREDEHGRFSPEVRDYEGRPFAVAFTHPVRIERFLQVAEMAPGKVVVHGISGRALIGELVRNNLSLLLNPANGYGKEFTVPEMSDVLAGVEPGTRERVVQEATTLQVGEPAHVPNGLTGRLHAHFDAVGGVREAALAWVRHPDGMEGYLLEVVGPVAREQLLVGIDRAIGDLGGRILDVMVGGDRPRTTTSSVAPFYPA